MEPKRILVIDDYRPIALAVASVLRRHGYLVSTAENGEKGIRVAEWDAPDLVLLDIEMPLLNGWQAVERLRAHATTAQIPIIAFSACDAGAEQIRSAGFTAYLRKPVRAPRLLAEIEQVLAAAPRSADASRRVA